MEAKKSLKDLREELEELDRKGDIELSDRINMIAHVYNLHNDDDRDEVIQFIAEERYYNE